MKFCAKHENIMDTCVFCRASKTLGKYPVNSDFIYRVLEKISKYPTPKEINF